MYSSFKIGIDEFRKKSGLSIAEKIRTDRDLPLSVIILGAAVVILIIIATPHVLGIGSPLLLRLMGAICIAFFAFMFVTVSSRIVGLVGVSSNPTSGMTIVTLLGTSLVFYLLGWTDTIGQATALTVGTVVCVASSIAGDISQDLKAGYIIGATPQKQQIAEIIGVVSSAFFIAAAVWLLGKAFAFGSEELPAPQATLMKTVIEGVLQADLPWDLVLVGAAVSGMAELLGVPSLPFAVGIYLPLSTMTPVFAGGCISYLVERKYKTDRKVLIGKKEQGVLLGSGLIAGEGVVGVLIAGYAFFAGKPGGMRWSWPEPYGEIVSLLAFAALGYFLILKTKSQSNSKNGQ